MWPVMLTLEGASVVPTENVLLPDAGVIVGALTVSVVGSDKMYHTQTGVPAEY